MSSVIGSLRVNLGLDSAKFESGARRVKSPLAAMKNQFVAVAGAAAALGGALSALTIATAKTATEIKQFSQVANAAPDELQRWGAASKTVGIEQEKLADILKDVNDRVGDFVTTGGGPMADFFENVAPKIGITADAFRDLSGPQALQLYVKSLQDAGLSQQEMTFYLEAMASDATALLPLLRDNGTEMRRLGENAQSLGGVMSNGTVVALSALDLALGDVATSVRGVGYRISGELAPTLTALATGFADAMREGSAFRSGIDAIIGNLDRIAAYVGVAVTGFGVRYVAALVAARVATLSLAGSMVFLRTAIMRTGIGLLIIGAAELIMWFGRVVKATGNMSEAFTRVYDVGKAVFMALGNTAWGLLDILGGVSTSIAATFVSAFSVIAKRWDALMNGMAAAWNMLAESGVGESLGMAAMGASNVSGQIGAVADGMFDTAAGRIAKGGQRIADAGQGVADAFKASIAGIANDDGGLQAATDQADGLAQSLDDVAAAAGGGAGSGGGGSGAAGAIETLNDKVEGLQDRAGEMKDTFRDAFKGLATGAKSFGDAVRGVLDKIADRLLDSAFDKLWGGALGGGSSGGLFGGVLGSIFGSANGNVFSGGSAIKAFANGGVVNGPTLFPMTGTQTGLMGEAGPEAIMPLQRGADGKLGVRSHGGGTVNVQVGVSVDDEGKIQAYVKSVGQQAASAGASMAVQQVKSSFGTFNQQYAQDGVVT